MQTTTFAGRSNKQGQAQVLSPTQREHTLTSLDTTSGSGEPSDPQAPATWQAEGRTAEIQLVRFKQDFTVDVTRQDMHWHGGWQVSVGPLVGATQDGVLLYDHLSGEALALSYTPDLQIAHAQYLHNLGGSWEIHLGDFGGQGQAQVLLYNPNSGSALMLILKPDLSLATQQSYLGWPANQVLYVGHFGMSALSVMLYDPEQARSTFVAFDASLNVSHQETVSSWGRTQQILVGSFLDRALCLEQHTCTNGDDLLVLDRKTGLVRQYVFSFGKQYGIFDNRAQAYLRDGILAAQSVFPIDSSTFALLDSLESGIYTEELY